MTIPDCRIPANDNFSIKIASRAIVAAAAARRAAMAISENSRTHQAGSLHRKRQAIGDPDCRLSEARSIPLLAWLRRLRRHDDAALVERYRHLVALCLAEPLQGTTPTARDGLSPVHRDSPNNKLALSAIEEANAAGWPSGEISHGEILLKKETKKSRAASVTIPAKRAVAINADRYFPERGSYKPVQRSASIPRWNDSILIAQIDGKKTLGELRAAIGPLLDEFEDAALDGIELATLGRKMGHASNPHVAAGAVLLLAVQALRTAWADIDRREAPAAARAAANVIDLRARIAEREARILPRRSKAA